MAAALGLACLGACGSVTASSGVDMDHLRELGVAPDLVYLVDLPGYEMAEQSMGGVGEEGFGVFYTAPGGRQVELRVDRGAFDDDMCRSTPINLATPPDALVLCIHDEVGWYRMAGDRHEYVAPRGDVLIKLSGGVTDVSRAALKAAVAGARRATGDRKAGTAPPRVPVERGDLPTVGDGAPDNEVGPGG
ncbi:hypothetical protein DI270_015450 [Microbispora triticiradicis]|uniref:Uncharacterized protein n=1 Tax=Microbispora triticiradicis TaxID=2200763 RepID=A0ABX9LM04_9ACTN|nr:hypothetical protein [Microbispora triticiradicis]RGA04109.1 hypothetical protein DI270_015450 [Microbispora triticiradicis]GLW23579.1 hypothetical protein Mame01_36220 [Microbispora amethystogenes]